MKLYEIIGTVPTETDETQASYIKRLGTQGYRKLGAGVFASAHKHASYDTVLKRGPLSDGWVYFIGNLINTPLRNNPYFPRVHDIRAYRSSKGDNRYYVAEVETLKKFNLFGDHSWYAAGFIEEAAKYNRGENRLLTDANIWSKGDNRLRDYMIKLAKDPKFIEATSFLHSLKQKYPRMGWDIHVGNIMLRGNHLVINDPFSFLGNTVVSA